MRLKYIYKILELLPHLFRLLGLRDRVAPETSGCCRLAFLARLQQQRRHARRFTAQQRKKPLDHVGR
jgi:hypothetical protein